MSIVESLRKLIDPAQAQSREEELETEREQHPRSGHAGDPLRFACRICGHVDAQKVFCPTCLADTMERQLPKAADSD
jgi:rubrerythrin